MRKPRIIGETPGFVALTNLASAIGILLSGLARAADAILFL